MLSTQPNPQHLQQAISHLNPKFIVDQRVPNTLMKSSSFSGIGIHTGKIVTMAFHPAPPQTGIIFRRTDHSEFPIIPATISNVKDTSRSTTIGSGQLFIHTVEHVLAALKAYQIDNLYIDISNLEPPVGNGSSDVFVTMIEQAGIEPQLGSIPIVRLPEPVYFSEGDIHVVGLPCDRYKISYTLSYHDAAALRAQFHSLEVTPKTFKEEISPCRTFSRYSEVSYLIDKGLIKGGSLANAVIIQDDVVFSKDGLFFPDEMARHKILDMIGDLSLIGFDFQAHIIAIRSGHASNYQFAKKMLNILNKENH